MGGEIDLHDAVEEIFERGIGSHEEHGEDDEEWDGDDDADGGLFGVGGDGGVAARGPIDVAGNEVDEAGEAMAGEVEDAGGDAGEGWNPNGGGLSGDDEGGGDDDGAEVEGLQSCGIAPGEAVPEDEHRNHEEDGSDVEEGSPAPFGDEEADDEEGDPEAEVNSPGDAAEEHVGEETHGEGDGEDAEGQVSFGCVHIALTSPARCRRSQLIISQRP